MYLSPRQRVAIAAFAGITAGVLNSDILLAQQNPNDQVVFHKAANDSNSATSTSFNSGTNWNASVTTYSTAPYTNSNTLSASTTPTAGYAYVVTGSAAGTGQMRSPNNATAYTFGGDSLTLIPYDGQPNLYSTSTTGANQVDQTAGLFLKGTAGQNLTINDLVLANGGALLNFNNTTATLNGTINLVPYSAGATLDGVALLAGYSGGIIDTRSNAGPLTVNSTITGAGPLHVLQSGGTLTGSLVLTASNTFSGGLTLDNTIPYGSSTTLGSGNYPLLRVNNPAALGTGIFTVTSVGSGPTIDNTTGSSETLSTNNAQAWNGSFQFAGSNALDLGSGAVTLGANVTLTTAASTLTEDGPISGGFGLIKAGFGSLVLTGSNTYTGDTSVNAGTLVLPATNYLTGNLNVSGGTVVVNAPAAITGLASVNISSGVLLVNDNSGSAGVGVNINLTGGAIRGPSNGSATIGGNIAVSGITSSLSGGAGGTLIINGSLSGSSPVVFSNLAGSTTVLANTNTYTGETQIATPSASASTLQMGVDNAINPASGVNFTGAGVGTLDLNGHALSIAYLTSTKATSIVTNSGSANSTLTLNTGGASYAGQINDGSGKVSVAYSGSGSQTFSGTSTYSGGTTVSSGVLTVAAPQALGTGRVTLAGGTLLLAGATAPVTTNVVNGFQSQPFSLNTPGLNTVSNPINGNTLTLTDGQQSETTSAFTTAPVTVNTTYGFTASFIYQGTGTAGHFTADGAVFTLQNDSRGNSAIGNNGSALGYADANTPITPSLGIALNLYSYNSTPGTALAVNGSIGTYVSPGGITLGGPTGEPVLVTLTYLAGAQSLTESLVGQTTGATYSTTYTGINLASILGGSSAYVGFTGSTGYDTSSQTITQFTFGNNNSGIVPVSIANDVFSSPNTSSTLAVGASPGGTSVSIGAMNIASGSTIALVSTNSTSTLRLPVVLTTSSLTIAGTTGAWTGKLDLEINDLVVQNGNLAQLTNMIKTGYAGSTWTGEGIISSAAQADTTGLTTLGIILNNDGSGSPLFGNGTSLGLFNGANPGANDVLIKYTYFGDANLDGHVDGSDYTRIDNGFNNGLTGWANGDFNYDGVVNGSDYTLIDNAFNTQGGSLSASATDQVASSAVPEPTALSLLGLASATLITRRRRR